MSKFTHLDQQGAAHMVDIADKASSKRIAIAKGILTISLQSYQLIQDQQVPKGDLLATARIAGIMAAKSTSQLIPLCHSLPLTSVQVNFDFASSSYFFFHEEDKDSDEANEDVVPPPFFRLRPNIVFKGGRLGKVS